jgi:hypothetical protein
MVKGVMKPGCAADFRALGTTWDALKDAIRQITFENAQGSTVAVQDLFAGAKTVLARATGATQSGTVGSSIIGTSTAAKAELGGHRVFLNGANINPNDLLTNMSNVMHEALHNLLGDVDFGLQQALFPKDKSQWGADSFNISRKLRDDCF